MLYPGTLSAAEQRNYKLQELGSGASATTFLMFSKASWRHHRETLRRTPAQARFMGRVVAVKCQKIPANDVKNDIRIMQRPGYGLLVRRNMACRLDAHDPATPPRWCEMSYEGPTLQAILENAEREQKSIPLNFAWTILHDLLKTIYFMKYAVVSSGQTRWRRWPGSMAHGDVHEGNVCLRKRGRIVEVKLIDWGRAAIPEPQTVLHPRWFRHDLSQWSNLAHRLLHGYHLNMNNWKCDCSFTGHHKETIRWQSRSDVERRQIQAFVGNVLDRATHVNHGNGKMPLKDVLKIMEDPAPWCRAQNVPIIRPVRMMPRQLNVNYNRVNWDESNLTWKIEEQYKLHG